MATTYYFRGVPGATVPSTEAWVVIIAGQSNAQGVGSVAEFYDSSLNSPLYTVMPDLKVPSPFVQIHTVGNTLEPLTFDDGTNNVATNNEGAFYYTFGSEIGLRNRWLDVFPGQTLPLVKSAMGGKAIIYWEKGRLIGNGGGGYEALLADFQQAKALLEAQGKTVVVKGIEWWQGENDGGNTAYAASLQALMDNLRADGVLQPATKEVIMSIPDSVVRDQQVTYVLRNSARAKLINTTDYINGSDNLHRTGRTQYLAGYTDIFNAIFGTSGNYPFPMDPGGSSTAPPEDLTVVPAGTIIDDQQEDPRMQLVTQTGTFGATDTVLGYGGRVGFVPNGGSAYVQMKFKSSAVALDMPTFGGFPSKCDVYIDEVLVTTLILSGSSDVPSREVYLRTDLDGNLVHTIRLQAVAAYNVQMVFDRIRVLPNGATASDPADTAPPTGGGGGGGGGATTPPANNMLKTFDISGAWLGGGPPKYNIVNGTQLNIVGANGEYYNQPVNQMNRPLLPNTLYRFRAHTISSGGGGVVQAKTDDGTLDFGITAPNDYDTTFTTGSGTPGKFNLFSYGDALIDWVHLEEG